MRCLIKAQRMQYWPCFTEEWNYGMRPSLSASLRYCVDQRTTGYLKDNRWSVKNKKKIYIELCFEPTKLISFPIFHMASLEPLGFVRKPSYASQGERYK